LEWRSGAPRDHVTGVLVWGPPQPDVREAAPAIKQSTDDEPGGDFRQREIPAQATATDGDREEPDRTHSHLTGSQRTAASRGTSAATSGYQPRCHQLGVPWLRASLPRPGRGRGSSSQLRT
jgi:hypothetical protein